MSTGPFTRDEYSRRNKALQKEMARRNLAALLLTTAPDVFYVTGFLTRFWESPARPWFVVVPATGDPVAVIPEIGLALMQRTWLTDIRTWPAPDPDDDGVSLLSLTVCELIPDGEQIGVPMGAETYLRMPLADYEAVAGRIGARRFVDGTAALQRVREIKSEAEVDRIRAACAVADRAFARVPELARAGDPLSQVFRRFQALLLEEGADWVSYLAGASAQGGYGDVISPADDRPLAAGDVLMLDTGAVKEGYFCDFDRNYAVGAVAADVSGAHAALWDATQIALDRLRPGMRACDAHALMHDHLAASGFTPLGGRFGHGLGLTLTEWPSLSSCDATPLRAGMVLTLEPGVEIARGRTLVHEENILLREDACSLLSARAPRALTVLT